MRILPFLLAILILPVSPALAATHSFFIAWSIANTDTVTIGGYRVYDDNHTLICQTLDGSASSMTCTIDTTEPQVTFTLVSFSTDNIESDPSAPFTIVFSTTTPLSADFTATTTAGSLAASFDASLSTGSITDYQWYFGDGSSAQGITTTHTYPTSGTYSLTLTVTDDSGNISTSSKDITVDINATNQAPVADIAINPVTGDAPLTVTLDGSGSSDPENGQLTYTWIFGDGTSANGSPNLTHVYSNPGTYTAQLTVTDPQGAQDTATSQPIVVNTPDDTGKQAAATMTFTAPSITSRNNAGALIPIYKLLLLH